MCVCVCVSVILTPGCGEVGGVDVCVVHCQLLSTDSERSRVVGTAIGQQLRLHST